MSTLKEPRISPVYYLGRNPALADRIAEQLRDRGVQVLPFDDLTDLAAAIPCRGRGTPVVIGGSGVISQAMVDVTQGLQRPPLTGSITSRSIESEGAPASKD